MKYVKRPVVIEAFRYGVAGESYPSWFNDAVIEGRIICFKNHAVISTLEGDMLAHKGDYIIKGVAGEIYPCKPDIFMATYAPCTVPKKGSVQEVLAKYKSINEKRRRMLTKDE